MDPIKPNTQSTSVPEPVSEVNTSPIPDLSALLDTPQQDSLIISSDSESKTEPKSIPEPIPEVTIPSVPDVSASPSIPKEESPVVTTNSDSTTLPMSVPEPIPQPNTPPASDLSSLLDQSQKEDTVSSATPPPTQPKKKSSKKVPLIMMGLLFVLTSIGLIGYQLQKAGSIADLRNRAADSGGCSGTSCSAPSSGCIAIHDCEKLDSGQCTEVSPDLSHSTVDAQTEANNRCKCVQVDVLNGKNGTDGQSSCSDGHIHRDPSTLIGFAIACPNNGCGNQSGGSGSGGSNPPPATPTEIPTRTCGETCTSDEQCKKNNDHSVCKKDSGKDSGMCVNSQCPNATVAGASCFCSGKALCGERCGTGVGCQSDDTCGFINISDSGSKQCNYYENTSATFDKGHQYCLPKIGTSDGLSYTTSQCPDGMAARRLGKSDGNGGWIYTGLTQQNIKDACNARDNKTTVTPTATTKPSSTPTTGPSPTPTTASTPTATPVVGQCLNIKVYKNDQVISPNDLKVGDTAKIAVAGTNATKARLKVNGGDWTETATKNSAGEYYINYTFSSSTTLSFSVQAELLIANVWQ